MVLSALQNGLRSPKSSGGEGSKPQSRASDMMASGKALLSEWLAALALEARVTTIFFSTECSRVSGSKAHKKESGNALQEAKMLADVSRGLGVTSPSSHLGSLLMCVP